MKKSLASFLSVLLIVVTVNGVSRARPRVVRDAVGSEGLLGERDRRTDDAQLGQALADLASAQVRLQTLDEDYYVRLYAPGALDAMDRDWRKSPKFKPAQQYCSTFRSYAALPTAARAASPAGLSSSISAGTPRR